MSTSTSTCILSSLPSELRLHIYAFIFPPNTDVHISRPLLQPTFTKSLLQLSRPLRHESLPSLYSPTCTFHLLSQHDLADWTRSLDPRAKRLIASIVVAMSDPPRIGRICEWIRQVDLGVRDMTGLRELRLRISLLWHQDAAKLGTELTKLVRPLFPLTKVRLTVEMVRCAQCDEGRDEGLWRQAEDEDEDDDDDTGIGDNSVIGSVFSAPNAAYGHHLWTWDFPTGSKKPLIHRRIPPSEGDGNKIRPFVMDNLLACAQALEQTRSPQQVHHILSSINRVTILPALSEPVRCKDCARPFLAPTTLKHLMQLLCEECGIELMAFCSMSCNFVQYVGVVDGLWDGDGMLESQEWHSFSCVRRGWTVAEKEGIRRVLEMVEGLGEDEEGLGLGEEDNEVESTGSGGDGLVSGLEARLWQMRLYSGSEAQPGTR